MQSMSGLHLAPFLIWAGAPLASLLRNSALEATQLKGIGSFVFSMLILGQALLLSFACIGDGMALKC